MILGLPFLLPAVCSSLAIYIFASSPIEELIRVVRALRQDIHTMADTLLRTANQGINACAKKGKTHR